MTVEERIVETGRSLGFVAVGFAAAGISRSNRAFSDWLVAGNHAGMEYLRRQADLRADPRQVSLGCRTVIVAAARYPVNPSPGAGFSFYARGADYHEAIRSRLVALAQAVRRETGARRMKICVDAAPLFEREWAVRAGVGWLGRQGQVVHPRYGCCLFLGEVLADTDLAPSPPQKNRCGRCRRCVEACPTGALGEDGRVDCRKCLSYLTIEQKGEIPPDMRPRMGETVFGCDFCTAVCPWNRFGAEAVLPDLNPRPVPSAEELLRMDEPEFLRRFAGTTVLRTGLERLRRNAAAVLGDHIAENDPPKSSAKTLDADPPGRKLSCLGHDHRHVATAARGPTHAIKDKSTNS